MTATVTSKSDPVQQGQFVKMYIAQDVEEVKLYSSAMEQKPRDSGSSTVMWRKCVETSILRGGSI